MNQTYIYKGPPSHYTPGRTYDLVIRQTSFLKRVRIEMYHGFYPGERIVKGSQRTYKNWAEFSKEWERPKCTECPNMALPDGKLCYPHLLTKSAVSGMPK